MNSQTEAAANGAPNSGGQAPLGLHRGRPGRKRLLIILAALLAAILLAAALWPLLAGFANPKKAAARAVAHTLRSLQKEWALAETALGFTPMPQNPKALQTTLYLGTAGQEELGVGFDFRYSADQRRGEGSVQLEAQRVPVFGINLQAQDDLVVAELPQLLPGRYGLHTETLGQDWNASPLSSLLGLELDESLSFSLFPQPAKGAAAEDEADAPVSLRGLRQQAWQQATANRAGTVRAEVNGQTLRCVQYGLALAQADAEPLLRQAVEMATGHPVLRSLLQLVALGGYFDTGKLTALQADTLPASVAQLLAGDVHLQVFVHRGRAVRLELDTLLEWDGALQPLHLSLDIGGQTRLSETMTLTWQLGDTLLRFELDAAFPEEGLLAPRLSVTRTVKGGAPETLAEARLHYNSQQQTDNLRLQVSTPGLPGALQAKAEGCLLPLPGTGGAQGQLDTIEITLGGARLHLNAEYSHRPLDVTLPELDADRVHLLLEMDAGQLRDLGGAISRRMLRSLLRAALGF